MPVDTTDHMFKVFYPEGVNPLPSHQYLWRIMADLHDTRLDSDQLNKKKKLLIKVLVLALDVANRTLNVDVLRTYYDDTGRPRDLDLVLDLAEKYPKSCDGIEKLSVYCSVDDQFEFVFKSERRHDDNSSVFFPESSNDLASHRFISRIFRHFKRIPPTERDLAYNTLAYFCKILIHALDVNTREVDVDVFYEFYNDNGEPVRLEEETQLRPKDPGWSDGIESLVVCCDVDETCQILFTSKRAHPDQRQRLRFPRHVIAQYRGNFNLDPVGE